MSEAASAVPPVRKLSALSRWSFGFGSVAYGIKDSGFATFLLLFYNQVVGLPAATVGAVIAAVLVVEAFADPFVGFLSDHTKSRWGRRHPWMYASAVPISAGWLLLWNPPQGWSEPALLGYLFGAALLVRLALSAFEIPSAAMGPELSADYDERTRLFSYRYLFAWGGGLTMLSLSYAFFLVPDAAHAVGLQNPDGYSRMALFGAVAMFFAIIGSSLGLHPQIKHMPRYVSTGESAAGHFRAFGQTVRNKGFIVLMIAGVFAYTAQGISFALSNYLYQFVWGFKGADYQWLTVALFAGAVTAFIIAPRATRTGDKHRIGAAFALANAMLITSPYILRLLGLFPSMDSAVGLPLLLAIFALNNACGISSFIIGAAMLSDVVEESEMRTGRRSEGVFFAGSFFVQKLVGGLGTLMAGTILTIAAFPAAAVPGSVSAETINRLILVFAGAMILFYGLGAFAYSRFPFGRAEHQARLARLGATAAE
ncbi:MAG: MFS transporter [Sphingomonas sp.]|uniref:MFS transporter n=1 Tax=Sphingomonas sp. TaxID=28214 RepID=UPI0025D591E6|nr:MFS transporter [Sphingomonas sp.]MBX9859189.1 MFS transporter [Sphingomonas sp.]MBY0282615.1 MFS transporter [Sphingomonas sp.]